MTTFLTGPPDVGAETVRILPGEHARILVRDDRTIIDGGLLWRPATLAELEALDTGGYPKPKPPPKPKWLDEYAANLTHASTARRT